MRLRLFSGIPYLWALGFAVALAIVQIFEHTDPQFVLCSTLYLLVAITAFNIAGGLKTLPGNFIFFMALLTCVVGIVTKALLGEPGQTNLKDGAATMEVYLVAMLGFLFAAIVERRFRPARAFMERALPIPDLHTAYLGCAILGVILDCYFSLTGAPQPGTVSSMLNRINQFTFLAIILGTIQTVERTNGRSNLSPLLFFLLLFRTALGLLWFTKEGIFSPTVAWIIGMAAAQYRLKIMDFAVLAGLLFLIVRFAVPYSQFGRNYLPENPSVTKSFPVVVYLLENFDVVDQGYADSKEERGSWHYFSRDLGQMERLTALPPDDDLIHYTDTGHLFGYTPTIEAFENLVPHFLWPNKPTPFFGNIYWHELGLGPEDDTTTGISFSPTADMYHQGGLAAVLLVEPLLACYAFLLFSFLLGRTDRHPVALVAALAVAHSAPESGTSALVGQLFICSGILLVAFLCRYVFPAIGSIAPKARKRESENSTAVNFAGAVPRT